MRTSWLGLGALISVFQPALRAQTASLPDAPVLGGQKLSLALPVETYQAPHIERKVMVCEAPPDGIYQPENQRVDPQVHGQVGFYLKNTFARVHADWERRSHRSLQFAFDKHRMVEVRVAVRPDGSIFEPQITHSSGKASYDLDTLAAVRETAPFDPMPLGVNHPVVFCFRFGYQTYENEMRRSSDTDFVNPPEKH